MPSDPFHVSSSVFARLTRLSDLQTLYENARGLRSGTFEDRALQVLDISVDGHGLDLIPLRGPVVIVANHPHGALDGLVLMSLVRRVRHDVKLLANRLLARIPELHGSCYFVDPFKDATSAERSRSGLRAAHLWLRHGGALIVFPSGEVAHRPGVSASDSTREESDWSSTAGRLAAATRASVVPASIHGENSRIFYAAGRLHRLLRTALLPRELLNKRGATVTVAFSRPLVPPRPLAPTVAPVSAAALEHDIRGLQTSQCLVDADPFQVYCAPAKDIPSVLREIGRLREVTYRMVGEGTGRSIDLDEFDGRYVHLFAWDHRERRVVGAYRLGLIDEIVADRGVDGLYTRRLFRYDARLFAGLPPAIELGRSFVRAEYQRHYSALLMLWKGIGQFVVRRPQYRVLLGPVSISTRYTDSSHRLLMAFLLQNHRHAELADLVQAANPSTQSAALPRGVAIPASIAEADALVSRFEQDGKGVPVLLRQYLKLNARVLGFNVDPAFGDALDALMMVDLADVDPSILKRYFGREGAEAFLSAHRRDRPRVSVAA